MAEFISLMISKLWMKRVLKVIGILFITWQIAISFRSFQYPERDEILSRFNYLERVVQQPLNSNSDIDKIGHLSGEWMLFSYSFTTYAFTSISIKDSSFTDRSVKSIKHSIEKVLSPDIALLFGVGENLVNADTIFDHSVLYLGHLNLMLGCYRMISDDKTYNALNDKISKSLFERYSGVEYLSLESYPSAIWVPDNTVALASLKMHSRNTGSKFESICYRWVEYAKQNFLQPETDVLYSTIDIKTGRPEEEPRGSMLGWSIMFIHYFDEEFAIELYKNYKTHFSSNYVSLRLFKERSGNYDVDIGDIDSGPVFLGYSIPANEFALSGAIISNDLRTAKKLLRLIDLGTNKTEQGSELKYAVRFVDLNISPMTEALVLNSITTQKWFED